MAENHRKYSLTVLRHGESEWNHDNRFCGWVDVGLTNNGLAQAQKAVEALVEEDIGFDIIYTSVLKRAKETAEIIHNNSALTVVPKDQFPDHECLKDLQERAIPYFEDIIVPQIKSGQRVLIVVHGTTSRALVKHLEDVSDEDIEEINVPNAIPFTYELDEKLDPLGDKTYHADKETVRKAIEKAASIGKKRK
eukprot:TCALIF_09673-PA protein Name:"Similar to gpmA 2,3-bisphosphoglycerate-dependent phosphoglycerate mutase (Chloroherpeton thalassium (strain ATCC 35110 / GB-78))" AED:0.18 eAED:0.19 QI:0/0/0.5/1/0/0.5/2/119/192